MPNILEKAQRVRRNSPDKNLWHTRNAPDSLGFTPHANKVAGVATGAAGARFPVGTACYVARMWFLDYRAMVNQSRQCSGAILIQTLQPSGPPGQLFLL